MLETLLRAFWLTFPALTANSFAVLTGGGLPIDMGRTWKDGRRILGDGKTWRGLAGGIVLATLVGMVEQVLAMSYPADFNAAYAETYVAAFPIVLAMASAAMAGDALGSFIKRRMGKERGESVPLMDQLLFLLIVFLCLAVLFPEFFVEHYLYPEVLIGLPVITYLLHRGSNLAAYIIGVKSVPW